MVNKDVVEEVEMDSIDLGMHRACTHCDLHKVAVQHALALVMGDPRSRARRVVGEFLSSRGWVVDYKLGSDKRRKFDLFVFITGGELDPLNSVRACEMYLKGLGDCMSLHGCFIAVTHSISRDFILDSPLSVAANSAVESLVLSYAHVLERIRIRANVLRTMNVQQGHALQLFGLLDIYRRWDTGYIYHAPR